MSANIPLTWNEALSGILGSISLASWCFLLIPQLLENYQQGSADGISLTFLFVWFLGDVTNLAGALWACLVPTVTALAIYFCFADAILISQCLYYRAVKQRRQGKDADVVKMGQEDALAVEQTEQTPLLNGHATSPKLKHARSHSFGDVTEENMGLPGSRRRPSTARSRPSDHQPTTLAPISEEASTTSSWLKNTISILLIFVVGAAGWAIAYKAGAWKPTPLGHQSDSAPGKGTPIGAEILGYISATLYLGARLPQIVKNARERSCDGLSLLFFLLSLVGNATYGAGILFHSVEKEYFLTNLPWLIGSLGTIAEDAVIFVQFSVYGEHKKNEAVE